MTKLKIERIGGIAGFGGTNSHLRSTGEVDMQDLTKEEQKKVEDLFLARGGEANSSSADTFRYKISRVTPSGPESIEADDEHIPHSLKQSVRDEIV